MTAQEWKQAEQTIREGGIARLQVDEYTLSIEERRVKNTIKIFFYVNGIFEVRWAFEECDIRTRFMKHTIKKPSKNLTKLVKKYKTKKEFEKWVEENTFHSFTPFWGSFQAFKSHLIKNNNSIQMI